METEFIYWRHPTPAGIKVEEVCGAEQYPQKVWVDMALQIWSENGKDGYREIDHFPSGAPFIDGEQCRISITHAHHFLAVATLPRTPEVDLAHFSPRTAMGIDAERADREQVLKIRSKFLSDRELEMIPEDDVEQNILAWTIKEAAYKAALTEGLDFRNAITIEKLPQLKEIAGFEKDSSALGQASLTLPDGNTYPLLLCSWRSEGCIVTIVYSPKCAR